MNKKVSLFSMICAAVLVISACGGNTASSPSEAETSAAGSESGTETKVTSVKTVLSWYAQPEQGGTFAAISKGYFDEAGLDVTIEPGGPQVSSIQIVASGKAEFGYTTGDKLVLAKSEGIPIIGLMAGYQNSPLIFMSHKDAGIKDFSDLSGRTVYTTPGFTFWDYVKHKYKLENVTELSYLGDPSNFVADENAVTQSYLTNEPFALEQQGIQTDTLLISESGYATYDQVLFTTEKYLESNPDIVKAYIAATLKGWDYYKDHSDEINPVILEQNANASLEGFAYASTFQDRFVFSGDASTHGVGYMSKERWDTLIEQLAEIGALKEPVPSEQIFTTDYLPE
ncbi:MULTISPECIES: ABC transporter substrate-binding protein [unclassified Paenibacillus]|uniref:ABC transporter substrate-binding protein n=1 Tax=unclassified Paenibacillus TaxID=185978 RepID=UPI0024063C67|nr:MULTISPECIES: ABC transporter substrate-binding protein [unclassified Paenibacillus]MDF9839791.1 NitT/TauT family transport system substrate-binding protein [Paenibacillus sp. PastF-2]MDF9846372.1 NitT/TauT family transport system substrate-binding protein [Paenibacillus sp. PastM-2]MDF9853279.1 NitT/TauT family transport system substrate-binding protein [Paenibacillus sp. PastF-1]MDH6478217.1 NitT/TauT family transport system substrate-binding protein [Paenibacillus sp. PastH-2]MDH6506284.